MEVEQEKKNAPSDILQEIDNIKDIESDTGKELLASLTTKLKALNGDSEDQTGLQIKTTLPWEELNTPELQRQVKQHVYTLAKEQDLLSREIDELEYYFDFDLEMYAYQAIVLMKLDKNLCETHNRLVPDLISEESFWRNYFYEVEKYY